MLGGQVLSREHYNNFVGGVCVCVRKGVKLKGNELVFMLFLGRVKSWTPLYS